MLKITYTETGLFVEPLPESIEDWIATRVILSVRTAETLKLEPCHASLLLPATLSGLDRLRLISQTNPDNDLSFSLVDSDFIEITLHGTWVNSNPADAEGVFVVSLSPTVESLLYGLWQRSQFAVNFCL